MATLRELVQAQMDSAKKKQADAVAATQPAIDAVAADMDFFANSSGITMDSDPVFAKKYMATIIKYLS